MGVYFLDTSAIIKCYFSEPGHFWALNLCDPVQGHDLYISQAALVEVVATICRKAREQKMPINDRDKLITTFRRDCRNIYGIKRVTNAVYAFAGDLCRLHKLRAYDAVQLACVLGLRTAAWASQSPSLIFVTADRDLIAIATTEGLRTEDPENYP